MPVQPLVLHRRDCFEVFPSLPANYFRLILTDPPYNTTACDWDTAFDPEAFWAQANRVLTADGSVVMTATQPFTSVMVASNLTQFKYELIWEKATGTGFLDAKFRPLKTH